ncbi:uncharacterized protein LOC120487547 isoform X2 [Pimephales promelas]|uniref:uncharacterized protein LOC120487547 isoform X2 n=1 Tax=Pimephales promelas TaxID=90988 RepID=UPI001955AA12|nr:uncharacterized protein LOC120487547 isoform X2 [Pimephales promelas]
MKPSRRIYLQSWRATRRTLQNLHASQAENARASQTENLTHQNPESLNRDTFMACDERDGDGEQTDDYCYWPACNPTARARRGEQPDPDTWISRKVKVFSGVTADFNQALRWLKKAETMSSVESADDGAVLSKRPAKFAYSSDEGLFHGPREVPPSRKSSAGPTHPPPPICIFPQTNTINNLDDPVSPIQPEMSDETASCSSSASDSISALTQTITVIQETLKTMLTRQDVMSKNIQEILLRLNQIGGARPGPETPIEIDVAQSLEELAVLEAKLKDLPDYKKRLTHHLSLIGGANPGEVTRRIMRAVASSGVWKNYSLHGKKGKKTLLHTTVYQVIKRAIMLSRSGLQDKAVEELVTNVLKHTPAHSKLQVQSVPEVAVQQQDNNQQLT